MYYDWNTGLISFGGLLNKMEYREKYSETRRKKIFLKALKIQNDLMEIFPSKSKDEIRYMVSNCRAYLQPKGRKLKPESVIAIEYFERRGINPSTAYRWFRYLQLPEDLKFKAETGELTKEKAIEVMANNRRKEEVSINWRFLEESRRLIKEVLNYD